MLQLRPLYKLANDIRRTILQEAIGVPLLWNHYSRTIDLEPAIDHGHLAGINVPPALENTILDSRDVARAASSLVESLEDFGASALFHDAIVRCTHLWADAPHDLAVLAYDLASISSITGGIVNIDDLVDAVIAETEEVLSVLASSDGSLLAIVGKELSSCRGQVRLEPLSPILINAPSVGADWLEVQTGQGELSFLQVRRSIPETRTIYDLAAAILANQLQFGPYRSFLDFAIRFDASVSYLWDCRVALDRGEFIMMVAPDSSDIDRTLTVLGHAHSRLVEPSAADFINARRIARTILLRQSSLKDELANVESQLHQAHLPEGIVGAIHDAISAVSDNDVRAMMPVVANEPIRVTLITPVGPR